jgi:hypothetical protein
MEWIKSNLSGARRIGWKKSALPAWPWGFSRYERVDFSSGSYRCRYSGGNRSRTQGAPQLKGYICREYLTLP